MSDTFFESCDHLALQYAADYFRRHVHISGEWDLTPPNRTQFDSNFVRSMLEYFGWINADENLEGPSLSDVLLSTGRVDVNGEFYWNGRPVVFRDAASFSKIENLDLTFFIELRIYINVFTPAVRGLSGNQWAVCDNSSSHMVNKDVLDLSFRQCSDSGIEINAIGSDEIDGIVDTGFDINSVLRYT